MCRKTGLMVSGASSPLSQRGVAGVTWPQVEEGNSEGDERQASRSGVGGREHPTPCLPGGLLAPWRLPKAAAQGAGVCGALSLGLPLSEGDGGDSPLRGLYPTCPSPFPLSPSSSSSEKAGSLCSFLPARSGFIKRAFVERRRLDNRAVALLDHSSSWSVWKWQPQRRTLSCGPRSLVEGGPSYNQSPKRGHVCLQQMLNQRGCQDFGCTWKLVSLRQRHPIFIIHAMKKTLCEFSKVFFCLFFVF